MLSVFRKLLGGGEISLEKRLEKARKGLRRAERKMRGPFWGIRFDSLKILSDHYRLESEVDFLSEEIAVRRGEAVPEWFLEGIDHMIKLDGLEVPVNEIYGVALTQWQSIYQDPASIARVMDDFERHPERILDQRRDTSPLTLRKELQERFSKETRRDDVFTLDEEVLTSPSEAENISDVFGDRQRMPNRGVHFLPSDIKFYGITAETSVLPDLSQKREDFATRVESIQYRPKTAEEGFFLDTYPGKQLDESATGPALEFNPRKQNKSDEPNIRIYLDERTRMERVKDWGSAILAGFGKVFDEYSANQVEEAERTSAWAKSVWSSMKHRSWKLGVTGACLALVATFAGSYLLRGTETNVAKAGSRVAAVRMPGADIDRALLDIFDPSQLVCEEDVLFPTPERAPQAIGDGSYTREGRRDPLLPLLDPERVVFQLPEHVGNNIYRLVVKNGAFSHMSLSIKDKTTGEYAKVPILRDNREESGSDAYIFKLPRNLVETIRKDSVGWVKLNGPDESRSSNRYEIFQLASVRADLPAFFPGVSLEETVESDMTSNKVPDEASVLEEIPESIPESLPPESSVPEERTFTKEDVAAIGTGALIQVDLNGAYRLTNPSVTKIFLGDSTTGQYVLSVENGLVDLDPAFYSLLQRAAPDKEVPVRVEFEGGFIAQWMRLNDLVNQEPIAKVADKSIEEQAEAYVNQGRDLVRTYRLSTLDAMLEGERLDGCEFDDARLGSLVTTGSLGKDLVSYGVMDDGTWKCKELSPSERRELGTILDEIEARISKYKQVHCQPDDSKLQGYLGPQTPKNNAMSQMINLYEQRHNGSEEGSMSVSTIIDHVNAVHGTEYTRQDLVDNLSFDHNLRRREELDLHRKRRQEYVVGKVMDGMSIVGIVEDSGWSESTIRRDLRSYELGRT